MKKIFNQLIFIAFLSLIIFETSYATPIYSQDAFCNGVKCGTMEIDIYDTFEPDPFWYVGVEIDGQFKKTKYHDYHYIQSVNIDDQPLNYRDGSNLSVPYIDTPPGGYWKNHFDYEVYYDENDFPSFYDKPTNYMLDAKTEPDNTLDLFFETWLVCTISEIFGPNDMQAKDDTYKIAPLLGWTWGFSIAYADDGDGIDELVDFTVTKDAFSWINAPSIDWASAFNQNYGTAPNQDWFNVASGDCKDCPQIPEPSTMLLLGTGLVGVAGAVRRRKKK